MNHYILNKISEVIKKGTQSSDVEMSRKMFTLYQIDVMPA